MDIIASAGIPTWKTVSRWIGGKAALRSRRPRVGGTRLVQYSHLEYSVPMTSPILENNASHGGGFPIALAIYD